MFRTNEAVDIGPIGSGYFVGWIADGEYLHYTVDIMADGERRDATYMFASCVRSTHGARSGMLSCIVSPLSIILVASRTFEPYVTSIGQTYYDYRSSCGPKLHE